MVDRFECVLSRGSAVATWVVVAVMVGVALAVVLLFWRIGVRTGWPRDFVVLSIVIPGLLVLILGFVIVFTWTTSPRSVAITGDAVVIERPARPIVIPLTKITSVRSAGPGDFRGIIRTFGSSGLWGNMGRFRSPALGNFRMYSTNMDDAVILDAGERFVVTPRERQRFVAALQQRMAVQKARPGGAGA
jgi:hypothetical protein